MNLKWLLVKRIALVAVACLAAGALLIIYQSALRAKQQNLELVNAVGREMDRRLSAYGRVGEIPERFPDWDLLTTSLLQSGQCAELRAPAGSIRHLNCAGLDRDAVSAPAWFVWLYRRLVSDAGAASATREIFYRGAAQGSVIARYEPVASASLAWASIAPLLGFSAVLVGVLCLMTFLAIDRALRPAKQIADGLNRMVRGDANLRLPPFRLREFDRISTVFNSVAADLKTANEERGALARRLVDAQERERRHIARELHDEIAQKLSALNAHAAVLRTRAEREARGLASDAKDLERGVAELMLSVRRTLTYLRPQEIDDLGLIPSLQALVAQHNERAGGKTSFTLKVHGSLAHLNAETNAHVYRIAQEALTNAAKHANARNVQIVLSQYQDSDSDQEKIGLHIIDDGVGMPSNAMDGGASNGTKAGLVGMRERVDALSGTFSVGPMSGGGFALEVEFPTLQRSTR